MTARDLESDAINVAARIDAALELLPRVSLPASKAARGLSVILADLESTAGHMLASGGVALREDVEYSREDWVSLEGMANLLCSRIEAAQELYTAADLPAGRASNGMSIVLDDLFDSAEALAKEIGLRHLPAEK
ncbi:hypothetical protein [Roseicyclus amphidinii]|uniref:hypothetical protein n=1 Tax=Roseicyclus amphidinii TaxID=3034232 RepID=UPI0024E196A9|nr:hypothetical protein [Roseicyclus sp. Amp-Y-6]